MEDEACLCLCSARPRAHAMELPLPARQGPTLGPTPSKGRRSDWRWSTAEQVGANKPRRRFTAASSSWSNKPESLVLHRITESLAR